jgi:hypothetical protein
MSEDYDDVWYGSVYEHVKEVGRLLGFDIHGIRFSGFWSQGDGASWYGYVMLKNAELQEALEYVPDDTWIRAIVEELAPLVLLPKVEFFVAYTNSRYCHEITMEIQYISRNEEYTDEWVEQSVDRAVKAFAKWIYKQLEEEYEHQLENETTNI